MNSMTPEERMRWVLGVGMGGRFARLSRKVSRLSALIRQRGRHVLFFSRLLTSTACMLPLLIHRSTVSRETCRRSATSWIVSHRKSPSWFPVACMASPALPNWSIRHLARSALTPTSDNRHRLRPTCPPVLPRHTRSWFPCPRAVSRRTPLPHARNLTPGHPVRRCRSRRMPQQRRIVLYATVSQGSPPGRAPRRRSRHSTLAATKASVLPGTRRDRP